MIIGISRNDQLFSICNNLLKHKQVLILYFINVKKTKKASETIPHFPLWPI